MPNDPKPAPAPLDANDPEAVRSIASFWQQRAEALTALLTEKLFAGPPFLVLPSGAVVPTASIRFLERSVDSTGRALGSTLLFLADSAPKPLPLADALALRAGLRRLCGGVDVEAPTLEGDDADGDGQVHERPQTPSGQAGIQL